MIAIALLVLPACASAGGEAGALPPRPSGAATTTGAADAEPSESGTVTPGSSPGVDRADPLAVYRAWWTALQDAYAAGNPDEPALAEYGVDPILGAQRASITAMRKQGVVQKTSFTLQPRLLYRTERNAEVEDCVRGPANTYYDAVSGRPRAPRGYRNEVPTEDRLLTTLQKRGDQWFVVAATARGEVAC